METSGKKTCFDAEKNGFCNCAAVVQMQVQKVCTDLDFSLLYILILGTYSKFARKNNFLALGVCFPQPCSSDGCGFAFSRSRAPNYQRIVSFPAKTLLKCVVISGIHFTRKRIHGATINGTSRFWLLPSRVSCVLLCPSLLLLLLLCCILLLLVDLS